MLNNVVTEEKILFSNIKREDDIKLSKFPIYILYNFSIIRFAYFIGKISLSFKE